MRKSRERNKLITHHGKDEDACSRHCCKINANAEMQEGEPCCWMCSYSLYPTNFSGYDITNEQHSKPKRFQPWNPRLRLRRTNYRSPRLRNENTASWSPLLVSPNTYLPIFQKKMARAVLILTGETGLYEWGNTVRMRDLL